MSSVSVGIGQTPTLYHRGQNDKCSLNRGAIGIDWFSATGPSERAEDVIAAVGNVLPPVGSDVPSEGSGRKGYKRGLYFPGGVELQLDGNTHGRWWLSVQGGACGLLGFERLWLLIRCVMPSAKCTRLDVCGDFFGERLTFVEDVLNACQSGCLRGPREFAPWPRCDADGKTLKGLGVYLGSSASERLVRVYDKGLQLGGGCGKHQRYELQLEKRFAQEAVLSLLELADLADVRSALAGVLASWVDFREGPRGDGVQVRRLPRCAFWDEFVRDVGVLELRPPVVDVSLERWCDAFRSQYGAVLQHAATLAGVTLAQAAEYVLQGVQVNEGTRNNEVCPLLAAELRRSSGLDTIRT